MTSKTLSRLSMRLKMIHETGDVLYPVKMKNTKTGKIAFRVSKEGNKIEDCIEIEDEQLMLDYVVKKDFSVRARTLPTSTKRDGLYGISKRTIVSYQLD